MDTTGRQQLAFARELAFARALASEQSRNSRQVAAFRVLAVGAIVALQLVFSVFVDDWTGAPMGPFLGYAAVALAVWIARRRFDGWSKSGYTIAFLDMPMCYWLLVSSWERVARTDPAVAGSVMMLLPVIYAGFILMASLTLDRRQTMTASVVAMILQWRALASVGHDYTFLTLVTVHISVIASICIY
jgi:hypothetical protein